MRSIMKCSTALFFLASFAMVSFHATSGQAQLRSLPRVSSAASVAQRIGITDITIDYHRPGVKDREIWGKLVPYNDRIPWRAGANDNTTITFTHNVTIEGQPVLTACICTRPKENGQSPSVRITLPGEAFSTNQKRMLPASMSLHKKLSTLSG